MDIKIGDTVNITLPTYAKRKWWQFWKPRWIEGPVETKPYRVTAKN